MGNVTTDGVCRPAANRHDLTLALYSCMNLRFKFLFSNTLCSKYILTAVRAYCGLQTTRVPQHVTGNRSSSNATSVLWPIAVQNYLLKL